MKITQNIILINQLDDKYIISQTRTMRALGASRFQLGSRNSSFDEDLKSWDVYMSFESYLATEMGNRIEIIF